MQYVALGLITFGLLIGVVVWFDKREQHQAATYEGLIDRLEGRLERAQAENVSLLRQIAGIDPTPQEQRADLLNQLGAGVNGTLQHVSPMTQAGPLPPTPTRWEQPADDYYDDPTDLTAPLDDPSSWTGIEAPELAWGAGGDEDPVPAPEPVPEGEHRPIIVGFSPGENPFDDIGLEVPE